MLASRQSFLRSFLQAPRSIGALAPATPSLAAAVAHVTHDALVRYGHEELALIELGAGTGALTRGIAHLRPVLVEQQAEWAAMLRRDFPDLDVRHECATQTLRKLVAPVGLVTSIPLLNNPQSAELKNLMLEQYDAGTIRFCVLYTYGLGDPFEGRGFRRARRARFVPRSIPPAHVWMYD